MFCSVSPDPQHPWIDEVVLEAMVVNGRVQPFYEVEPRRYRLRVLNAANERFFAWHCPMALPSSKIGADQGLLPSPLRLATLLLAPGERPDLIVEFAPMLGERIQLTNGAFQMMQFRVSSAPAWGSSQVLGTLLPRASLSQNAAARTREMTLNELKDPAGNTMRHVAQPHAMYPGRYLWHFHLQEREANDMMRPYVIQK